MTGSTRAGWVDGEAPERESDVPITDSLYAAMWAATADLASDAVRRFAGAGSGGGQVRRAAGCRRVVSRPTGRWGGWALLRYRRARCECLGGHAGWCVV